MSEHLCLCVFVCAQSGSAAGKPSSSAVVYSKAPSRWHREASVCLKSDVCGRVCVCVQEWKRDRVRMMTDGNVIHPLIIYMPHLYSG